MLEHQHDQCQFLFIGASATPPPPHLVPHAQPQRSSRVDLFQKSLHNALCSCCTLFVMHYQNQSIIIHLLYKPQSVQDDLPQWSTALASSVKMYMVIAHVPAGAYLLTEFFDLFFVSMLPMHQ